MYSWGQFPADWSVENLIVHALKRLAEFENTYYKSGTFIFTEEMFVKMSLRFNVLSF